MKAYSKYSVSSRPTVPSDALRCLLEELTVAQHGFLRGRRPFARWVHCAEVLQQYLDNVRSAVEVLEKFAELAERLDGAPQVNGNGAHAGNGNGAHHVSNGNGTHVAGDPP